MSEQHNPKTVALYERIGGLRCSLINEDTKDAERATMIAALFANEARTIYEHIMGLEGAAQQFYRLADEIAARAGKENE